MARSTALHARLEGRLDYLTGPLARYALNSSELSRGGPPGRARTPASDAVCTNPFRSIVVRAVELVFACDEALRLIAEYEPPDPPAVDRAPTGPGWERVRPRPPGASCSTATELDDDGLIRMARIVPPTSQNQLTIESDLRRVAQGALDLPDDELAWRCEQAVRNHDPCISCAAHFLDVTVVRA